MRTRIRRAPRSGRRVGFRSLRDQRGQGLVEYLIIVSLMAVASIAVVRALGEVVQSRFKTVAHGLQGDKKAKAVRLDDNLAKRKDMGNFFDGVEGGGSGGGDR